MNWFLLLFVLWMLWSPLIVLLVSVSQGMRSELSAQAGSPCYTIVFEQQPDRTRLPVGLFCPWEIHLPTRYRTSNVER